MDEMTIQRAGRQQNLLAWSQRVADCRSSGLSVNRWCAEHDIRPCLKNAANLCYFNKMAIAAM